MIECLYSWLFSASYATVLAYFYQSSIESLDNWSVYFAISPHVASCCISLGFFFTSGDEWHPHFIHFYVLVIEVFKAWMRKIIFTKLTKVKSLRKQNLLRV